MTGRELWAIPLVLLFGSFTIACAHDDNEISVPNWLGSDEPVGVERVSQEDYPYLVRWLNKHAEPAAEYMVRLFDKHQVVILAEEHNVKEHKDFVIDLIPRLYHEAGVRCIGWEFSQFSKNRRLEKLISAPSYDEEAVLQFARDCSPDWNSKEHWEIIKAVWNLNRSLESGREKMRLIGLPGDIDLTRMHIVARTKPIASPEFQASSEFQDLVTQSIKYDTSMAQHVGIEILQKGDKGLVFVGLGHDWTQYHYPPEFAFGVSLKPMGWLLKEKYGDRVFQVRTLCSTDPSFIDHVMQRKEHRWVGFNMRGSPFANILVPVGRGAPDVPWARLAGGYVYVGPRASFHRNTAVKGFVTETMFRKHKQYYDVCYGHFNSATEVDEHLHQHRWPKPRR